MNPNSGSAPAVVPSRAVDPHAVAAWTDAGFSIIPIVGDGTKRPAIKWAQYQRRVPTNAELRRWFVTNPDADQVGAAIVCGAISGNVEMLEIEGRAMSGEHLGRLEEALGSEGLARETWDLLHGDHGYVAMSPSGGIHIVYRVADHPVPGNQKVARRLPTEEEKTANPGQREYTLAETRGQGGYFIAAPTGGRVHPTGEAWTTISGEHARVPVISWEARCALHAAVTAGLDELDEPLPVAPVRRRPARAVGTGVIDSGNSRVGGERAGDDFNARADWFDEILGPAGWIEVSTGTFGSRLFLRPGKDARHGACSASAGFKNSHNLFVWTSSTTLPTEEPLSKFWVWAHYNTGGDLKRAARELGRRGYGKRREEPMPVTPRAAVAALAATAVLAAGGAAPSTSGTDLVPVDAAPAAPTAPVVDEAPALRSYPPTPLGNSHQMFDLHGPRHKYVPVLKKWYAWDAESGCWVPDLEDILIERAYWDLSERWRLDAEASGDPGRIKLANARQQVGSMAQTIRALRTRPGMTVDATTFDADASLFNTPTGVLNLAAGTLHEHDPKYYLTRLAGARYVEGASCPKWMAFLERQVPDPEVRAYLQQLAGYTVSGEANRKVMILLQGPKDSGKSLFLEVLRGVLGTYARTVDPELFFASRVTSDGPTVGLNDLKGARLAALSELPQGVQINTAFVNRVTGGDTVKSRDLYESNTEWKPRFVAWIASNWPPLIAAEETATWGRMRIVPFSNPVTESEKDYTLFATLMEEAAGILNWALEGLAAYREHGLATPLAVVAAVSEERASQDSVTQFLHAAIINGNVAVDPARKMLRSTLYPMYKHWVLAQAGDVKLLGARRFAQRMRDMTLDYVDEDGNPSRFTIMEKKDSEWFYVGLYQPAGAFSQVSV